MNIKNENQIKQINEIECLISMFPGDKEFEIDLNLFKLIKNNKKTILKFDFTINFTEINIKNEIPKIHFILPKNYPLSDKPEAIFICSTLSKYDLSRINNDIFAFIQNAFTGDIFILDIYYHCKEIINEFLNEINKNLMFNDSLEKKKQENKISNVQKDEINDSIILKRKLIHLNVKLGRRALYFHHIIAPNKRSFVLKLAQDLHLGGFSKIGWPGIIIIEGAEDSCQEYVRYLQRLRWKQMVVRGEQIEEKNISVIVNNEDDENLILKNSYFQCLNSMRKFNTIKFCELTENCMSKLATECKNVGLEDLFLSTMKIYRKESK